jgi:hypothetical protein
MSLSLDQQALQTRPESDPLAAKGAARLETTLLLQLASKARLKSLQSRCFLKLLEPR